MKWIGLAGEAAMRGYYLQEILAILVLVALLFGCGTMVLILLFMLNRGGQALSEFVELRLKKALHHVFSWRGISGEPRT